MQLSLKRPDEMLKRTHENTEYTYIKIRYVRLFYDQSGN